MFGRCIFLSENVLVLKFFHFHLGDENYPHKRKLFLTSPVMAMTEEINRMQELIGEKKFY